MRRKRRRGRCGQRQSGRKHKRKKAQTNSCRAKRYRESLPWSDGSPNCQTVPAGETSDRLHYCLNSHSNGHKSQPQWSVPLRIISTGPFRISASTEHVRNNQPQCPLEGFFFSMSVQQDPSGCTHLQGRAPALLQNIITQCMQQYKQLFISMKSSINTLFKCSRTVAKCLERCWGCAISPLLQLWL